jgi:hypothetical protein
MPSASVRPMGRPIRDRDDGIEIEGGPAKRFQIYSIYNGQPHSRVAEYDTEEELAKHRQRLDRVEAVRMMRRTGIEYIPTSQYLEQLKAAKRG